jgi:hypothetical protein
MYSECITKEALEVFESFKIEGQFIFFVIYADELVLLPKEGKVLKKMIDKLIEIRECHGMRMNVGKTKVMRISRQPFPAKVMIGQKRLEKVKYLRSISTNDGRCTPGNKSSIATAKTAFNKHIGIGIE